MSARAGDLLLVWQQLGASHSSLGAEDMFEGGPERRGPGPHLGVSVQSIRRLAGAGGSRVFDLQAETAQGGRGGRPPPPVAARLGAEGASARVSLSQCFCYAGVVDPAYNQIVL